MLCHQEEGPLWGLCNAKNYDTHGMYVYLTKGHLLLSKLLQYIIQQYIIVLVHKASLHSHFINNDIIDNMLFL